MSNKGLEATESPRRVRVGVRRINNLPVWIVCGILFVFLAAVCAGASSLHHSLSTMAAALPNSES
jgi:hypothetical protein